jgi:hypothetical protein
MMSDVSGGQRYLGRWGQWEKRRRWRSGRLAGHLLMPLLLVALLSGCSLFGGGSGISSGSPPGLTELPWCDQPSIAFIDNAASPPTTITSWDQVKGQLGFTPYLPASLPKDSCLVLARGTVHDPILGGSLSITWSLPASGPLSFAEAPKRADLGGKPQCTADSTDKQATLCLGTIGNTSITIAARQPQADLQSLFNSLKSDVNWVPVNTKPATATAAATAGS